MFLRVSLQQISTVAVSIYCLSKKCAFTCPILKSQILAKLEKSLKINWAQFNANFCGDVAQLNSIKIVGIGAWYFY